MEPPEAPNESACCNSGCNPCIFDVYEEQLKKYKQFLQNGDIKIHTGAEMVNCLDPISFTNFTLKTKEQISPTVCLLRFQYSDQKDKRPNCCKCNPGQYILLRGQDYDGEFTKAYTPLPLENDLLEFVILVKIYSGGRMSRIFRGLQIGQTTSWRGPYGDFAIDYQYKYFLFIAQGTGIAPIFAVIKKVLDDETCESFIKLFFCCHSCEEILLREELYQLASFWNFHYEIFISNTDNLVKKYNEVIHPYKVNSRNLADYISGKSKLQVIICGSEDFNKDLNNEVIKLNFDSSNIYLF